MKEATLTHWKKYFNKDYLGTWSLPDGKDVIVTIDHVEKAIIKGEGGREDVRPIIFFKEYKEPMVLNATNGKIIHKILCSEYVEKWYSKRVQLYVDRNIKIGKGASAETTDGLRVREFVPKTNQETEKAVVKAKIREALQSYKGEDLTEIKDALNKEVLAKTDTTDFLNVILNRLQ